MPAALKKITAEAKRMQKKHPGAKWTNLVKKAGAKYRAGKIGQHAVGKKKARRKKRVAKVGTRRRKTSKRKHPVTVTVVRTVGRRRRRHYKQKTVRRVGRSGNSNTNMLLIGAIAVGAILLLRNKSTTSTQLPAGTPPLVLTTNQTRNNQSQAIINYAIAGGLAIDAIIKLINSLNTSSDAQVKDTYDGVNQTGQLPDFIFT